MTGSPSSPEAEKELEELKKLVQKTHPSEEMKRRREEFTKDLRSGIVDEKPTRVEAHALAVYIKALETAVTYYAFQSGLIPAAQRLEVEKYLNDDAQGGLKKLWGIGGRPGDSEGTL